MKEVSIISRKIPAGARSDRYAGSGYAVAGSQQPTSINVEAAFASMMSRWFVRDVENKGIRPADYGGEAVGLYSNSYLSALGLNPAAGSTPVAGATELSKLTDVLITSPADGQILTYDATLGKWVNSEPVAGGLDDEELAEYLTTNRYATQDWITQQGYATQTWAGSQFALRTVAINAGAGLTGGGNLTASRTLSLATTGTAGTYTKVTTDAYGRVTKGATLQAGDIPTLSISKISGLQTALDGKLDADVFDGLFEKVYVSGYGYAIRAKLALYTEGWLSAKGMNSDAGSTVVAGASSWDEIEGKPSTFPPSAHTHAWGDITGKPTTLAGYGIQTEADGRYFRRRVDWIEDTTTDSGDLWGNGIYLNATGNVGKNNTFPSNYGILLNFAYYDNNFRLQIHATAESLRYNYRFDSGRLTTWRELLSEYNYTNYTVTKAGAGASGTWGIGITGNAASATKLQTARTLWGQSFNGTANVTGSLTGVTDIAMTGELTGFAAITSGYGDGNRRTRMDNQFKILSATTGWAGGLAQYTGDGDTHLGTIAGAYGVADELQYYFYGGTYTTPVIVIRDGKVAINTMSAQHMLHVNGGIYSDEYVQVGSALLKYDSTTGALYVEKSDGTQCGFYATGFMSSKGANDDAGGAVAGGGSGEVSLADITGMRDEWKLIVASYPLDQVLRWPTWSEVTGKPSTFTPSSHTHTWAQVTGKPTWIPTNDGSGSGIDADLLDGTHKSGLFTAMSYSSNKLSVTVGGTTKSVTINAGSSSGNYLPLGGGTLTGDLIIDTGTGTRLEIDSDIRLWMHSTTGWARAFSVYTYDGSSLEQSIAGAFGQAKSISYCYYGGKYNSPAMVILPSKNVGIGTTSPSYKLHVAGSAYASGGFQNGSDVRFKHILRDLPLTPAQVASAPAFLFRWKDGTDRALHAGTSAQYWQAVLPQVVMEGGDGRLSMQYGVAALMSVVAVARTVLDHEARITKLEQLLNAV